MADRCWIVNSRTGQKACACEGKQYFLMGAARTCSDCQRHCNSTRGVTPTQMGGLIVSRPYKAGQKPLRLYTDTYIPRPATTNDILNKILRDILGFFGMQSGMPLIYGRGSGSGGSGGTVNA